MAHTPGPWEARNVSQRWIEILGGPDEDGTREIIGTALPTDINRGVTPTSQANARLIAAAPELLEACKELVRLAPYALDNLLPIEPGSGCYQDWDAVNKAIRHTRGIIAKAERGTP